MIGPASFVLATWSSVFEEGMRGRGYGCDAQLGNAVKDVGAEFWMAGADSRLHVGAILAQNVHQVIRVNWRRYVISLYFHRFAVLHATSPGHSGSVAGSLRHPTRCGGQGFR